jgi:SAM-dependent methyltransferase
MTDERRLLPVREGYDLWAATYDATESAVVAMDARYSLRMLDAQPDELVLDAGCGTGRHLAELRSTGARVAAFDFSLPMLSCAEHDARLLADMQRGLPFADATFDAVLCSLVGEHLDALVPALTELRRVLKDSGRMVFSVIHPDRVAAGVEAHFHYEGVAYRLGAEGHSVQDYLDAVVDAGFGDVAFASFRGGEDAGKFNGQPLLFLMAATASSPADGVEG